MRLVVAGVEYGDFVSASSVIRLDALSNTFGFEATARDAIPLPFRGGEACEVTVDGELVLTGFIELVNVNGGPDSHKIDLQGRDKTADLLDSSIGSLSDLRPPITLKGVIQRVIAHLGADLDVVDEVGPASFNQAEDLPAPEPGQNAFEFLEKLARKRQVLLTSNGTGDVVIAQGAGVTTDAFIRHRVADDSNNVLGYSVSYDSTGRFNLYTAVSELNMVPLNAAGTAGVDAVVNQQGSVTDRAIRVGRQLVLVAEAPASGSQGKDRATWEAGIRKARGRVYSVVVHGYRNQTGELWKVNQLVDVVDEFAGIDAKMLINSVTYSLDPDQGRSTSISLVERNAYSLALAEPETDEHGSGLFA